MSGRYRTVALQAVGVAILAAFVFIAFLRPSEPDELAGIDAPGGEPAVVNPDPDDEKDGKDGNDGNDKKGKKGGKGENGDRGDDRLAPGGDGQNSIGAEGSPGGVGDTGVGGVPSTPPDGDDDPGDDQYTDLVSVLMKEVGDPALFREIDDP